MKKKSLLILSATAGAGHFRAGEALAETARALRLPVNVSHEDILTYTSPLFKKLYSESYLWIANTSPEFYGYLYKHSESSRPPKPKAPLLKLFDQINYKRYMQMLRKQRPDAVLCTHFLPYAAIADEIASPSWKIPFFSVTTDYSVHSLWVNPSVKKYYVATEEAGWIVASHGIPQEQIVVTGIPVHPQFCQKQNRRAAAATLRISSSTFTVMILSGGYGMGVVDTLVPSIAKFLGTFPRRQFQLLVICGRNQKLYDALHGQAYPENVDMKFYQFVNFIDKLMDASDVLITKSGGLTVSEALAKQLPMIVYNPIPGQETYNSEYLLEHGAALSAGQIPSLQFKLKTLINGPGILQNMRTRAHAIGKPDAAGAILRDLIQSL